MALQVKRTGKSGGDITSLCGDGFNHDKAKAVANILNGTENYFVREAAGICQINWYHGICGDFNRSLSLAPLLKPHCLLKP